MRDIEKILLEVIMKKIILILLFVFSVSCNSIYENLLHDKIQNQIEAEIKHKMLTHTLKSHIDTENQVDLTISDMQSLKAPFNIGHLNVKEKNGGTLVTGRMINTSSVTYEDVNFEISAWHYEFKDKGQENFTDKRDFTITKISPGNSSLFEVYLPNIPPDKAKNATITFLRGKVLYR